MFLMFLCFAYGAKKANIFAFTLDADIIKLFAFMQVT
jgi:hypothetical protein